MQSTIAQAGKQFCFFFFYISSTRQSPSMPPLVALRRGGEKSRAKERVYSFRDSKHRWSWWLFYCLYKSHQLTHSVVPPLPKKLTLSGTPILFTHGLHIVRDDFLTLNKDTLPFKTEPRHESGLLSDNVSIYTLLNKLQNVNNIDTKFSLDVDRFSNDLRNA